jgi:hypothetical protein
MTASSDDSTGVLAAAGLAARMVYGARSEPLPGGGQERAAGR